MKVTAPACASLSRRAPAALLRCHSFQLWAFLLQAASVCPAVPAVFGLGHPVAADRQALPQVILNNLYKHTALQSRFACNMVALVDGTPQSLSLKGFLRHFLDFR